MLNLSLLTDLYELTMMQGYFYESREKRAVFDMFFRKQPFDGGYSVFAGLETLLKSISTLQFNQEEIEYLKSLKIFQRDFLDYLKNFKFTGDIYSVEEGEIVFPNEPLIRIEGKLLEIQLLESLLLNIINFQTLIATKSARVTEAAKGKAVLEFGLRRAQGIDGAISGSRAAFIGGAVATSNVLAGKLFNIPVKGTMAHSWVMSFNSEIEAFEKYSEIYPENSILLVDTYNTLKSGIPNAIKIFKKLRKKGYKNYGIRLDSGDLEYLSKEARKMLDKAGFKEALIIVSNELDEYIINELNNRKAPIDAWGVGTHLITAKGDPSLSGVYKIVAREKNGKLVPTIKISNNPEKISNPGIKNIYRFYDKNNNMIADLLVLIDDKDEISKIKKHNIITFYHPDYNFKFFELKNYKSYRELLIPVMKNGKIIYNFPSLPEIQKRCKNNLQSLDETYKRLLNPHIYKVSLSKKLRELKSNLINEEQKKFEGAQFNEN